MRKNVVLIMVDQLRFDAININGNKTISTPNLDNFAGEGINYINAYSSTPTCVPARASLLTGLSQKNHGKIGYVERINFNYKRTIATEFNKRGYYCKAIGKMHVHPSRKLCGFHHVELHDGFLHTNRNINRKFYEAYESTDDYLEWLKEKMGYSADLIDLGIDCNSWVSRPWPFNEMYHPTNWVVTKGIEFLKKRDRTMPFFLKLSFTRPHSPYDPPRYYYDMYMNNYKELQMPKIGEWAKGRDYFEQTYDVVAKAGLINEMDLKRAMAGYYGLITHIDHQIGRFMIALEEQGILKDTVFMFVSDHGDQMGEHGLFRKGFPYQGSCHIPMIIYDPSSKKSKVVDEIVDLQDVLPTLIELATGDIIDDLDGKSILSGKKVREYLHGEHQLGEFSSQFIITKDYKYIWFPMTNYEQLFNIKEDKNELENIIDKNKEVADKLRNILIEELKNREEGFVVDGKLSITKNLKTHYSFLDEYLDE